MKKDNLRNSDFNIREWDMTVSYGSKKNFLKSTNDGSCNGRTYKKKIKVECPYCKKTFKNVKGIIPKHTKLYSIDICPGDKYYTKEYLKSIEVLDMSVNIGDEIVIATIDSLYPKHIVVETISKITYKYPDKEDIIEYYLNYIRVSYIKEIIK